MRTRKLITEAKRRRAAARAYLESENAKRVAKGLEPFDGILGVSEADESDGEIARCARYQAKVDMDREEDDKQMIADYRAGIYDGRSRWERRPGAGALRSAVS